MVGVDGTQVVLDVDLDELQVVLSGVLGRSTELVGAVPLGASSRATPWRIDGRLDGDEVALLLRYGESTDANEVVALRAMADHPIPTPKVVYWDEDGGGSGVPVFVSEFIDGRPLLPSMIAGEEWAVDLYLETVRALQEIHPEDLPSGSADMLKGGEPMRRLIESAYQRLDDPTPFHTAVFRKLVETQPTLPELAFSNGDLWPENLLVEDQELVGVIDWQHAGWSDPIYEFLLPFFLVPELCNRGIEERYLRRLDYDPALLRWYHGVEYFEALSFVLKMGEPFEMHTEQSLNRDLEQWLTQPTDK